MASWFEELLKGVMGATAVGAGINQLMTSPTTTVTANPPLAPSPLETTQMQLNMAQQIANLREAGYDVQFQPGGSVSLAERPLRPEEILSRATRGTAQGSVLTQLMRDEANPPALRDQLGSALTARRTASMTGRPGIDRVGLIRSIMSRQGGGMPGLQGQGGTGIPGGNMGGLGGTTIPPLSSQPQGGRRTSTSGGGGSSGLGTALSIASPLLGGGAAIAKYLGLFGDKNPPANPQQASQPGSTPPALPTQIPSFPSGIAPSSQAFLNLFGPTSTGAIGATPLNLGGTGGIANPFAPGPFSINPANAGTGLNAGQFSIDPGFDFSSIGNLPGLGAGAQIPADVASGLDIAYGGLGAAGAGAEAGTESFLSSLLGAFNPISIPLGIIGGGALAQIMSLFGPRKKELEELRFQGFGRQYQEQIARDPEGWLAGLEKQFGPQGRVAGQMAMNRELTGGQHLKDILGIGDLPNDVSLDTLKLTTPLSQAVALEFLRNQPPFLSWFNQRDKIREEMGRPAIDVSQIPDWEERMKNPGINVNDLFGSSLDILRPWLTQNRVQVPGGYSFDREGQLVKLPRDE